MMYFQYGSLICGVVIVPVAVLGIIGNFIAAGVFRRQRSQHAATSTYSLFATSTSPTERSSINILLIALTFVDTLLLILATPLCSTIAIYNFSSGVDLLTPIAYMTIFTYPAAMMAQTASVWTMILISLERYTAICHPLSSRAFAGKTKKALAVVVAAAVLYNACRFGEYTLNEFGNATVPLLRENEIYMNVYMNWSYFTLVFALPFLVLLLVNFMITRTIVRARRQRRVIVSISQQNRREQRTALMMAAVVLAYMACNTLALILNCWEAVGLGEPSSKVDQELFQFLSDLNNLLIEAHSGLTFLVYFRFSGHFRGFVYHQMRFLCYLKDSKLKKALPWGQRPTEALADRSRGFGLLLMKKDTNPRSASSSSRRGSSPAGANCNRNENRFLSPYHNPALRQSTYVAVARGSLETHLDPFRI